MVVLTDQPLKTLLQRPNILRKMAKWMIGLSEFDIDYHPQPFMKAQVSTDFVAKYTISDEESTSDMSKEERFEPT